MVIVAFTYGWWPQVMFKKIVGKQPSSRKEIMERVHRYMKQEDTTFEKIKTDHGERESWAPYARGNTSEHAKNQTTRQTRFHCFPQSNLNTPPHRHSPHNEVVAVSECKKNTTGKSGEKTKSKDQGWYCEFYESTRHATVECTMLRRELENKMQSG